MQATYDGHSRYYYHEDQARVTSRAGHRGVRRGVVPGLAAGEEAEAGTAHRRILGELGRYKLDLGDGSLIHGTPDQASVGSATTHGCLRLREADL